MFSFIPPPPISTLFPYTTLFRSLRRHEDMPWLEYNPSEDRCRQPCPVRSAQRSARGARRVVPHHSRRIHRRELVRRILRSEEHTSELQSRGHLVCRLLLEKKNDL